MKKIKSLTIKNYHVQALNRWLQWEQEPIGTIAGIELTLNGKDARTRNRFLAIIGTRSQEIEKDRTDLLTKHSHKEEDGKPKMKKDGGFDVKDMPKFLEEYNKVLDEDFIIDVLPSNEGTLKDMQLLLNNLTRKFDIQEGAQFDLLLTEFDKI